MSHSAAVITVSDKGYAGQRTDTSGFPFLWEAMARDEIRRDPSVLE